MKLIQNKFLLLPCAVLFISGCAPKLVKEEATLTEAKTVKADIKLEMLTPPTSKKLAENLITPLEIGQFRVLGSNGTGLGELISDKINAGINQTGYVQVVTKGAKAILSGTLTISQLENGSTSKSLIQNTLENGDNSETEAGSVQEKSDLSQFGSNAVNKVGGTLINVFAGGLGTALTSQTMQESTKRISAVLVYKITDTTSGQILVSGNLEHELSEKQSAMLLSKGMPNSMNTNLSSDSRITNKLLDIMADKVAEEVSPHPHVFLFNWISTGCGVDDSFDSAIKYASQGLDSEAEDKWKKLEVTAKDSKCRAASLFNHGLLKLRKDQNSKINQKEAYDMFVEADALDSGNKEITSGIKKLKKIAFTNYEPIDPKSIAVSDIGKYLLTVITKPRDCDITIIEADGETDYEEGMTLKPGNYKVKVSSGNKSKTKKLTIKDRDVTLKIKL
jgi:hypothetical protein